jgi:hypothetical protein
MQSSQLRINRKSEKTKGEIKMKHADLWNRFAEEIYFSFIDDENKFFSSNEQKYAIIAFAYDAEVNSGGHIAFFDCFAEVFSVDDVVQALRVIGGEKFAMNFLSATNHIKHTADLGYIDTITNADSDPVEDFAYYNMNPSLPHLLEEYIHGNKERIFI